MREQSTTNQKREILKDREMTHAKGAFVGLSGVDLPKCETSVITTLFNVINRAYAENYRFDIMKNARIKDVSLFSNNIGFTKKPAACLLFVYVEGEIKNRENFNVAEFEGHQWYTPKPDLEAIPQFIDQGEDCILGTVGFKPHHEYPDGRHFEVTVFTALQRGVGKFLLPIAERYFATQTPVDKYIAEVVVEHDLVPYYENVHNYLETKRFYVSDDYDPKTTGLEEGIECNPFHMATMVKSLV